MGVFRKASNKMGTAQVTKKDLDILGLYRAPKAKITGGIKYQTDPEILHEIIEFYAKNKKPLRKIPVRAINRFKHAKNCQVMVR